MILHGGLFFLFCFCGLHRYIDPGGDTGGPGILLAQPAELLAHMVRALTIEESDGPILYLQMHDIIAHIIQIIVVLVQRDRLGDAVAEIDHGHQRLRFGGVGAVQHEQECCRGQRR